MFLKLDDISKIQTGKHDANHEVSNGKYRFYTCAFEHLYCDTQRFKGECLILPGNGANVGEVFYYNGEFDAYQRTYVIDNIKIIPKYLYYHMLRNWKNINSDKQYGSATNYIRMGNFTDYEVNIKPILEQKAIIAKIEQLFSELDNAVANLKTAKAKLKIYRQAVLKKAFEGELTKEWREKQTNLPTADELLEQIKIEREEHYKQQLEEWKQAVKEWEDNGKNGKRPSKPSKKIQDEIFTKENLPQGWVHCPIKNIGIIATGATPLRGNTNYWTDGTIPWIKSGALNELYVKEADEYVTKKALDETNIKLFPIHTLLIALYGEGKTRGMCSELLIETTTNQAIAGIIQEGLEEKTRPYLKQFLIKNYQDIRRKSSGGVQPNLNSDIVKNTLVPLCSLEEQNQIVQEIESRLSVCDKIEETIANSLAKSEALRQSILKKAFEGKILSIQELENIKNHPEYESAEALLKRIKKER
ncbi:MAG: restriction endonuclease subunit S [Arcobacteraceae bacterium]